MSSASPATASSHPTLPPPSSSTTLPLPPQIHAYTRSHTAPHTTLHILSSPHTLTTAIYPSSSSTTPTHRRRPVAPFPSPVTAAALCPWGRSIVTSHEDNTVAVRDFVTGDLAATAPLDRGVMGLRHISPRDIVAVTTDGSVITMSIMGDESLTSKEAHRGTSRPAGKRGVNGRFHKDDKTILPHRSNAARTESMGERTHYGPREGDPLLPPPDNGMTGVELPSTTGTAVATPSLSPGVYVTITSRKTVGGTLNGTLDANDEIIAVGGSGGNLSIIQKDKIITRRPFDLSSDEDDDKIVVTSLALSPCTPAVLAVGGSDGWVSLLSSTSFRPFYRLAVGGWEDGIPPSPVIDIQWAFGCLAAGDGQVVMVMEEDTLEVFWEGRYGTEEESDKRTGVFHLLDQERLLLNNSLVVLDEWEYFFKEGTYISHNQVDKGDETTGFLTTSLSPQGRYFVTGGSDGFEVYNISRDWHKGHDANSVAPQLVNFDCEVAVCVVQFSGDGAYLAVAHEDGGVVLYEAEHLEKMTKVHEIKVGSKVTSMDFSPSSNTLAVGTDTKGCHILSPTTGKTEHIIKSKTPVISAVYSHDGSLLAIATGSSSEVTLYGTDRYERVGDAISAGEEKSVSVLAFDSLGRFLAVGVDDGIVLVEKDSTSMWSIRIHIPTSTAPTSLQFTPTSPHHLLSTSPSSPTLVHSLTSFTALQSFPSGTHISICPFLSTSSIITLSTATHTTVLKSGQLISDDHYPHPTEPTKLFALTPLERAQLLYRTTPRRSGTLPMEKAIRRTLAATKETHKRHSRRHSAGVIHHTASNVTSHLASLLNLFPRTVFATPRVFSLGWERENPRLLNLCFSIALVSARGSPHVMMNPAFRSRELLKSLIDACEKYPEVVVGVVQGMVLWNVPTKSLEGQDDEMEDWRVKGGKMAYNVGEALDVGSVFVHSTGGNEARPMVLPVPYLASLPFLAALINHCPAKVTSTDEMGLIISEIWDNEIKKHFLADFVTYLVFVVAWGILVCETNVSLSFNYGVLGDSSNVTSLLWLLVFVINLSFGYKEALMIRASASKDMKIEDVTLGAALAKTMEGWGDGLAKGGNKWMNKWMKNPVLTSLGAFKAVFQSHLVEDWWNTSNIITFIMVNLTLIMLIHRTSITVECAVITTFFILLNLIGFLRGFESSGWLVTVLRQNIIDSHGFLIVIGTLLLGFAIMFRILLGPYDEDYSSFGVSIFSAFDVGVLGGFDRAIFDESQNTTLTMILFLIFCITVTIVAMNGYVAVLGNSFGSVAANEEANMRFQKMKMIVDYLKRMSTSQRTEIANKRKYFFALVPVSHEDVVGADDATRSLLAKSEMKPTKSLPFMPKKNTAKLDNQSTLVHGGLGDTKKIQKELAETKKILMEVMARLEKMDGGGKGGGVREIVSTEGETTGKSAS